MSTATQADIRKLEKLTLQQIKELVSIEIPTERMIYLAKCVQERLQEEVHVTNGEVIATLTGALMSALLDMMENCERIQ